jgi:hypothetical protein
MILMPGEKWYDVKEALNNSAVEIENNTLANTSGC